MGGYGCAYGRTHALQTLQITSAAQFNDLWLVHEHILFVAGCNIRGFQTMRTAAATIKGFEVLRMIRRGHCLTCKPRVKDEIRFINKLFDIFAVAA